MSNEIEAISENRSPVAVVRIDGHYRVLVTQAQTAGAPLLTLEGTVVRAPSRHSLQIGRGEHLEAPGGQDLEGAFDRFPWRFLNHSCEPNCLIRGRTLRALRTLEPWEQITFDYNTTEEVLATPFSCACQSARCCAEVRGFRFLSQEERILRRPLLAPHLRQLWSKERSEKSLVKE